jgi:hypothetical protein
VKPLAIWLAGFVVVFGVFAVVVNAVRGTDRVFVVVDSSFPMTDVWNRVPRELDALDNERFTEFALATEKDLIHTWSSSLSLTGVNPFAPCGFEGVEGYAEVGEADELILITTEASCDTGTLTGSWTVINLEP